LVHSQTATGSNYPASPDTLQPGANPNAGVEPKAKGFAGLVAYMDKLVGKIADEIEALGLAENTVLLFVGDNGTDRVITSRLGNRPLPGGKSLLDEAGTRVPLIVHWKGQVSPGGVSRDLVDLTDFLPTLLAVAGVNLPADYGIDGHSFLPQLCGQKGEPRQWVYRHLNNSWFIRDHDYRFDSNSRFWDIVPDPYTPKPAGDSPAATEARQRLADAVKQLHAR